MDKLSFPSVCERITNKSFSQRTPWEHGVGIDLHIPLTDCRGTHIHSYLWPNNNMKCNSNGDELGRGVVKKWWLRCCLLRNLVLCELCWQPRNSCCYSYFPFDLNFTQCPFLNGRRTLKSVFRSPSSCCSMINLTTRGTRVKAIHGQGLEQLSQSIDGGFNWKLCIDCIVMNEPAIGRWWMGGWIDLLRKTDIYFWFIF